MERPNSGDLGGPDVGRGWDDVIRDGVRTAHSSLTLTAAPSNIPTGGFVNDEYEIKPSSTMEEVEKITAKEIKRCLFNHGHHQTVSMNNIDSFEYGNFSGQDTATSTSHDQAIKDQLPGSAFRGVTGSAIATSHKNLHNKQQGNANNNTIIKRPSAVKQSLQLNESATTTEATTLVPSITITIKTIDGKYFKCLPNKFITSALPKIKEHLSFSDESEDGSLQYQSSSSSKVDAAGVVLGNKFVAVFMSISIVNTDNPIFLLLDEDVVLLNNFVSCALFFLYRC